MNYYVDTIIIFRYLIILSYILHVIQLIIYIIAFINAASSNANNWLLNRNQISEVLMNHIPWLARENKHRLLLSFDAQNTGLIKYVRLSSTLLCCSEPAMIKLCTVLNRTSNGISKQTASGGGGGVGVLGSESDENILDCLGLLLVLVINVINIINVIVSVSYYNY